MLFAVVGCGTGSDSADPNADGGGGGAVVSGAGSGNSAAGASGHVASGGTQNGGGGGASGAPPVGSHGGTAGTNVVGMAGGVSGGAGGVVSNEPNPVGNTVPWGTPTLPSGRGAIEPYTEYEAEAGTLSGATMLGPTRTGRAQAQPRARPSSEHSDQQRRHRRRNV